MLSVDDHPLLREGIAAMINNQNDMAHGGAGVDGPRGDSAVSASIGPT